jgi:diketogulonate reductase-like aldo/keto reductase
MTGLNLGQLREIAKKHGKEYGRDFIIWAQKNGILKDPSDLNRERNEEIAKRAKFENRNAYAKHLRDSDVEYRRKYTQEWRYSKGIQVPMSENEECAHFLIMLSKRNEGMDRMGH